MKATKSTFGSQVSSKRHSAPSFGFGSGTRAGQDKVFVSQEHAKLVGNPCSPGPAVYTLTGSVSDQPDSTNMSMPKWAFGTSDRFMGMSKESVPGPGTYTSHPGVGTQVSSKNTSQPIYGFGSSTREHLAKTFITEEHNKALHGVNSPGPATYMLQGAVGKQQLNQNNTEPAWVFGTGQRFVYDHVKRAAASPGPGAYLATQSVGPQVASTKPTTPRFGFGTGDRSHQEKVFIGEEHAKISGGKDAPGPGQYVIHAMTGQKLSDSRQYTASSWGFGTAERFNKHSNKHTSTPGPGEYVI